MQEKNTPESAGKSNGNKFANPLEYRGFEYHPHSATVTVWNHESGFTKREVIAKDVMAGLAASPSIMWSPETLAKNSVTLADALLAELAKPQGE